MGASLHALGRLFMVSLPTLKDPETPNSGCGTSCGAGLEKVYPSTAVRYGAMAWIGEFSYRPGSVFSCGAKVVIETDRGVELGQQVSLTCTGCPKSVSRDQIKSYINNSGPEFYRLRAGRVLREATPADIADQDHLNAAQREDIDRAALLAAQLNLDMKIVTVEHLLGGERIVFYFQSEARVDFRDLVRELANHYRTRIEMRQVGARDEARLVADYEICGRECCCKNFLKKLRPVTMKMAKLQKSTLDPTKVSGRCGRLRCCLRYEHEGYEELAKKLPRMNSFVDTGEFGVARVLDRQILTQLVLVEAPDGRQITVPVEEIVAFDVKPPPRSLASESAPPPSRPRPSSAPERTAAPPDAANDDDDDDFELDDILPPAPASPRDQAPPAPTGDRGSKPAAGPRAAPRPAAGDQRNRDVPGSAGGPPRDGLSDSGPPGAAPPGGQRSRRGRRRRRGGRGPGPQGDATPNHEG